jgi:hypothetical protein
MAHLDWRGQPIASARQAEGLILIEPGTVDM